MNETNQEKRPQGRPPGTDFGVPVSTNLSSEVMEIVRNRSASMGVSVSAWLRMLVVREVKGEDE